jgi:hypothetical protein
MLYEEPNNLGFDEKEILLLKALIETIDSMVNHSVFKLYHKDPHSSICFLTRIHQQYFNILLTDFLSLETFKSCEADVFEQLQQVCKDHRFYENVYYLEKAAREFQEWLNQDVEFEHGGETRKLWFPSIEQEIALKITRKEFIKICGNISKHNPMGLNRQAKTISKIFKRNDIEIALTDALLIMGEFYEQFHDDLFSHP